MNREERTTRGPAERPRSALRNPRRCYQVIAVLTHLWGLGPLGTPPGAVGRHVLPPGGAHGQGGVVHRGGGRRPRGVAGRLGGAPDGRPEVRH